MNRTLTLYAFLLATLLPALTSAQEAGIIPGDILVMLTPEGNAASIAEDLRTLDGVPTGLRVDHEASKPMRIWLLKFDHAVVTQDRMLQAVKQHPAVMMAQNDHPVAPRNVPADPQYDQQWHHQNIQSEMAWAISTGGLTASGDTIVVCIVEGANLLHTDLVDNRWLNNFEVPGNGIDDDGNGYVDDYRGWNAGGNNDVVYSGAHGTSVAGMIGAKGNNDLFVTGANWNVKLMVVTYASTSQANVIAAYTYPLVMRRLYNDTNGEKGAFVVATNASWGIDNADPDNYPLWCAVYDTLGTAGVLNCGATANNNVNVDQVGDMPTACSSDFMVSVTATNNSDVRTFSAYGATTIDVGAPGANVVTTSGSNASTSTSGTSFASPLTAGVIGLLYSAPCPFLMNLVHSDPQAGALYVRQMLFAGVDQVGNLPDNTVTGGRINAGTSMQLLMAACGACPTPYGTNVAATAADAATCTWNAFTGGPFKVRYRLGGSEEWTTVEDVEGNLYAAEGLLPCATYEFQVGSDCGDDTFAFSNTALLVPPQSTVPTVAVSGRTAICEGGNLTLTSSAAFGNNWSNGETTPVITVQGSGTYLVTVDDGCNTFTSEAVTVEVLAPATPVTSDMQIPVPGTATLLAEGDNINWFAQPNGGVALGSGNTWQTPFLDQGTTFWCSSTASGGVDTVYGGRISNVTQGQYHNNGSFWLTFTANEGFIIRSVKVYANGEGSRNIGLVNMPGGTAVSQGSFAIPDGEQRVQLDFVVPGPGNYGLRIMSGNPQLWRDGNGSNPAFPFALGALGAITGTTANNGINFYYFFYDWEVEMLPVLCESERVPVSVELLSTGINETEVHGLHVYPSPADNELVLELDQLSGRELLLVFDATGRSVMRINIRDQRTMLNTAPLADGVYTFRLLREEAVVGTGRFMVTHR